MAISRLYNRLLRPTLAGSLFALLVGVATIGFLGMLHGAFVAKTAQHDAAAINVAGSLRMQSYRIATALLDDQGPQAGAKTLDAEVAAFERRLHSPELLRPIPANPDDPVREAWEEVHRQWTTELKPLLVDGSSTGSPVRYLDQVDRFVGTVDNLVTAAQSAAEARIHNSQSVRVLAMALLSGLVLYGLYRLHMRLVLPVQQLNYVAGRLMKGDFEARARYLPNDELGMYARTFNRMADTLTDMQRSLAHRVSEKTAELRRRNSALELVYNASRDISAGALESSNLKAMLDTLERVTGLGPLSICLAQPGADKSFETLSTSAESRPARCSAPDCKGCMNVVPRDGGGVVCPGMLALPLEDRNVRYGLLLAEYTPGDQPRGWQLHLAETVASHIAAACARERELDAEHRIVLMEERAVIARELHDSLAQALSYMKIQVARLQGLMRKEHEPAQLEAILSELRDGLNSAYEQLRELLTTFRLGMDSPGLESALRKAVKEFSERGDIPIRLDYRLSHWPLNANEEIHLLQIAREALANVVRHSQATRADVVVAPGSNHDVVLEVLDNGVGLAAISEEPGHHHGTAIMQERAEGLGGMLRLGNRAGGGTRVMLTFRPESMARAVAFSASQNNNQGVQDEDIRGAYADYR
ncbi:type IV pili methyl-accepting chemotaxis transducer N-terminal domain-containing protein [Alkalilimnicola ehrlichii]|uniref:type IV pili methyl-accepting chemotaxis transducer N-terminal domain-containing protein n=1 Tax=Alkalilimnicola ehrlichii TaxID=351052 RepID=UPI003B9E358B